MLVKGFCYDLIIRLLLSTLANLSEFQVKKAYYTMKAKVVAKTGLTGLTSIQNQTRFYTDHGYYEFTCNV